MRCTRCGSELTPGDAFCGDCGQPAAAAAPPVSPGYPPPAPAPPRASSGGGCWWFGAGCLVGIAVTVFAVVLLAYVMANMSQFN